MNASTATIYRHTFDRAMDEDTGEIGGSEPDTPPAWRFSIEVATGWENAFFDAPGPTIQKIALRSAVTMSPEASSMHCSARCGTA
jgi:NAD dependent epimerase/dehydratase family enzyme